MSDVENPDLMEVWLVVGERRCWADAHTETTILGAYSSRSSAEQAAYAEVQWPPERDDDDEEGSVDPECDYDIMRVVHQSGTTGYWLMPVFEREDVNN